MQSLSITSHPPVYCTFFSHRSLTQKSPPTIEHPPHPAGRAEPSPAYRRILAACGTCGEARKEGIRGARRAAGARWPAWKQPRALLSRHTNNPSPGSAPSYTSYVCGQAIQERDPSQVRFDPPGHAVSCPAGPHIQAHQPPRCPPSAAAGSSQGAWPRTTLSVRRTRYNT